MVGDEQQPQESTVGAAEVQPDGQSHAQPSLGLADTPSRTPFRWGRFVSYLGTFVIAIIIVALGAGIVIGNKPLKAKATAITQKVECRISIQWPALARAKDAPPAKSMDELTWMPQQLREELLARAFAAIEREPDPFGPDAVRAVGEAMVASGWFDGPPRVERGGPSELRISGQWRVPAAAVRTGDKEILVGWDGRPMPVVYDRVGSSGMLFISGAIDEPVMLAPGKPDCAKAWPGGDVQSGLELLALLAKQPYAKQVAGVEIGRHKDEKSLEIVSRDGGRIVWGGRPAKPLMGEASTEAKLGKLEWLTRTYGRIDAGRSAQSPIEIWWPLDRPLEMDRSASANAGKP